MAIVTINKKIFEKEIGKLDQKMQEKIVLFGTPLESIDNKNIQIEVFPNRPDLLSYHGFKRSFLSFLGRKTGLKKYKVNKPKKNYKIIIDSSVRDIRPYTACAIVKNIKLNEERIKEIIEIQEKLHNTFGRRRKKFAIGIYPLEKIKLPITFKAIEPDKIKFIPLGSDKKLSGLEILQKHSTGREYAHLLAGKPKFPVFIDANKRILSMPPIINSQETGRVNEKTKNLFIECSGFNLDILKKVLNIIVTTLAEMKGEIYQMDIKYRKKERTPDLSPQKTKISLERTNRLLGIDLTEKKAKQLIKKMGHNYEKSYVESPAWRVDILHEIDLIEDIAIAYGYENFIPKIPNISTIGEEDKKAIIKRKISYILTGLNMLELSNYHLTNKQDQFKKMGVSKNNEKNFISVEDSKTDYNILRKDLSSYLLKTLSKNVDAEYPQKIFEIGKVFEMKKKKIKDKEGNEIEKEKVIESENLGVALAPGNFTELKQILEYLSRMLDIKIKIKEAENPPKHFIEGRVGEIYMKDTLLGYIGEIHPKILNNWRIKMPVALFEINLKEILD